MTGLVFSLSSLQNFAVAQTADKTMGVEKKANGPTSIPDAQKKIADAQAAGLSAQGGVSQPTRNVLVDLVNILIDLLKSDVSRLETARHEADKKWTSNVEDLKLLLGKQSERIKELEAGITALRTEARQQKELQGSFSQEVTRLSASLAAKRCESGYVGFRPHDQPTDGNGGRLHKKRIAFSTPFASVPVIAAGINHLDVGNAANTRLVTTAADVDKTGFDLSMYEWSNSHTYGSTAVWMACAN